MPEAQHGLEYNSHTVYRLLSKATDIEGHDAAGNVARNLNRAIASSLFYTSNSAVNLFITTNARIQRQNAIPKCNTSQHRLRM